MANGRGAWTPAGKDNGARQYKYVSGLPMDGVSPKKGTAYLAVNLGVKAIQTALNDEGYSTKLAVDGVFGQKTEAGVTWFQAEHGLKADGAAGATTCLLLWRKPILLAATTSSMEPKYLYGQVIHESSGDPGACGFYHESDRGLVQINTTAHTEITLAKAHETAFALDYSARRFQTAWAKYTQKGAELQLWCSILQHHSPTGAATLYKTREYETPANKEYVETVLSDAEGWDA